MKPHECNEDVVVQHALTGAVGLIIRGGYRPRVQWFANRRVVRMPESELRFKAADESAYRRSLLTNDPKPGESHARIQSS